jgi:uncharacterized protein YndB with AHSA1/START domain
MNDQSLASASRGYGVRDMDVNRNAAVIAEAEIEVAAPPETVWEVISDLERWPSWNPEVKSLALSGPVAPGSEFRWKAGGVGIRSQLEEVEPPRKIGWTGKAVGLRARHVYNLGRRDDATIVTTTESFDGVAARLFRKRMQATLETSLDKGLDHLKAEAERRSSG